jgi:hypothetical protein
MIHYFLGIVTLLVLVFFPANVFSQKDACASVADPQYGIQYATKPGVEAAFEGGKDSLKSFLKKHAVLIKTENVSVCDVTKASIEFIVKKDGSVTFIKMLKPATCDPLRKYIDEMFSRMPKWTPAKCNGKPVNSKVTVPFNLEVK